MHKKLFVAAMVAFGFTNTFYAMQDQQNQPKASIPGVFYFLFNPPVDAFDPNNYHALVNQGFKPGVGSLNSCLQAMAHGYKGVYSGAADELETLTAEQKELIKKHNMQTIIYGRSDITPLGTPEEIAEAKKTAGKKLWLGIRTWLFPDMLKPYPQGLIIYTQQAKERAFALKKYDETYDEDNDYLRGKLLGYPEEDLVYFYEYNQRPSLETDKQKAAQFFAERNLTPENLRCIPATSSGNVQ